MNQEASKRPENGELVSCMRTSPQPYMTVNGYITEQRGAVTRKVRYVVSVISDDGRSGVVGMSVIRDAMGYLWEVPRPSCGVCEAVTKCECVPC